MSARKIGRGEGWRDMPLKTLTVTVLTLRP